MSHPPAQYRVVEPEWTESGYAGQRPGRRHNAATNVWAKELC
jgi:hypothetical protein